jgi:hypothetical protein
MPACLLDTTRSIGRQASAAKPIGAAAVDAASWPFAKAIALMLIATLLASASGCSADMAPSNFTPPGPQEPQRHSRFGPDRGRPPTSGEAVDPLVVTAVLTTMPVPTRLTSPSSHSWTIDRQATTARYVAPPSSDASSHPAAPTVAANCGGRCSNLTEFCLTDMDFCAACEPECSQQRLRSWSQRKHCEARCGNWITRRSSDTLCLACEEIWERRRLCDVARIFAPDRIVTKRLKFDGRSYAKLANDKLLVSGDAYTISFDIAVRARTFGFVLMYGEPAGTWITWRASVSFWVDRFGRVAAVVNRWRGKLTLQSQMRVNDGNDTRITFTRDDGHWTLAVGSVVPGESVEETHIYEDFYTEAIGPAGMYVGGIGYSHSGERKIMGIDGCIANLQFNCRPINAFAPHGNVLAEC